MRKILIGLCVLVVAVASIGGLAFLNRQEILRMRADLPSFTSKPGKSEEVMIEMSDGVRLRTIVHYPDSKGPHPAILVRSPYADMAAFLSDGICGRFVRYSYICVFQDTRGQGGSEGDFVPGRNEIEDGSDTLHWIAGQKFQDGNIAMVGPSYLAGVQWAAAAGGLPPEVKTLVPAVYTTDNHGVMYHDGMFRHETFTAWASRMRAGDRTDENAGQQYQKAIRYRPHLEADVDIFGERMDWYREMITSESPSAPFWSDPDNQRVREMPEKMDIPILMVGGWYDVFFGPQFSDWRKLATRSESRFIIGPWTHIGAGGEALENPNSGGGLLQWKTMLNWLDHHLKGAPLEHPPGLSVYSMHQGTWSEYETWPPQTQTTRLFLNGGDKANSCEGGVLASKAGTSASVAYEYDPDDPAPTHGGAGMLAFILPGFEGRPAANQWQPAICTRGDVLSFQGKVLEDPFTISGELSVTLTVSSTVEDTSFTAKLMEVLPDGRAINIRDSITSLKYRNGADFEQTYVPGEVVQIAITFWPIEWQVQPGSRLRLDVSSSDFPKFHAHSNSKEPWASVSEAKVATQTVFTGAGSWIDLPVHQ